MKRLKYNLGSLFLTVGFCLISYTINSQDIKLTRQEQKEARRIEKYANFTALDSLLESKNFVLKADFLENQYGQRIPVSSLLNFIRVESPNVVLQTGSNNNLGYNGVGGVTAEGKLEQLKIHKDFKNLSFSLQFNVLTNIGAYDISMTINSDNIVRATISGVNRGKLIYDGKLESFNNSIVYKGQTGF